jgi:hypothetical protein
MYGGGEVTDGKAEVLEIPGISIGQQEYYPYVYFPIKLNLLETY